MTMKKRSEKLPRSAAELETLAAVYATEDTSAEMDDGVWIDPRPMKTTSLRLPAEVVEALKQRAQQRGMRYTTLLRQIVEDAVRSPQVEHDDLAEINARLARIEAAVRAEERSDEAGHQRS